MCGNRFESVEFHRFLLNSVYNAFQSEWIMRAKLNEKSSKQHTVCCWCYKPTAVHLLKWKSVLKFKDYLMHGRTEFLWASVCVCEYVWVTKMNVTRFTITQMNLTQSDKSWYENTGRFISKEFKANEPLFFSHSNFSIHKRIHSSLDWHWWRS